MSGATMASAPFSNAIRTPNLAIRVGAAARTILRCDRAGGKTWHAAHRQHGRSGLTAPRLGIASSHITTCVASKLPRNQRLERERANRGAPSPLTAAYPPGPSVNTSRAYHIHANACSPAGAHHSGQGAQQHLAANPGATGRSGAGQIPGARAALANRANPQGAPQRHDGRSGACAGDARNAGRRARSWTAAGSIVSNR